MSPPEVSKPEEFVRETRLIELPRPAAGGKKLVIRIGALNHGDWWSAFEGIPTFDGRDLKAEPLTEAEARQYLISSEGPKKVAARLAIVEPEFCFGPEREPGKVWWKDLHPENQDFILDQVRDLSGISKPSPAKEAANAAAGFPARPGGEAGSAPA